MLSSIVDFISRLKTQRKMEKKGLVGSRKLRKQEETLARAIDKSKTLGFIILTLTWLTCIAVLVLPTPPNSFSQLVVGQVAPETIYSQMDFTYEDENETSKLREKARNSVPIFYQIDSSINTECLKKLETIFTEVNKRHDLEAEHKIYKAKVGSDVSAFVEKLTSKSHSIIRLLVQNYGQRRIFRNELDLILNKGVMPVEEINKYSSLQPIQIVDTLRRVLEPVQISSIPSPGQAARQISEAVASNVSLENREAFSSVYFDLATFVVRGNLIYNEEFTNRKREEAAKLVSPYMEDVVKGEIIISRGSRVTNQDLLKLKAYGEKLRKRDSKVNFINKLMDSSVICLMLMILIGLFIYRIHPEVMRSSQKMWVIGTVVIFSILLNQGTIELFNRISPALEIPPFLVLQFITIALPSVLLTVLIGFRIGLSCGLFVSVVAALQLGNSFDMLITGLFATCVAGVVVRDSTNYRAYFVKAFVSVWLILMFINMAHFWDNADTGEMTLWTISLSFINALVTAIIALLLLFVYETFFKVTTNMSLLLLCDYNHPLLKRLQLEAPGTYHHSLMVSTLAEHAAQDIGANPIKARVGALFHDIGKLAKPEYFTENNQGGSKHDELHPRMSALVILNHVKEGVDLALKYKLRKIIRDAIEQHHGTDLVFYFYKRACDARAKNDAPVEESEYRYPGPRPQEKEVVLISLADCCEAACRALEKPSPSKIEAQIWEIFRKRIRDGQLDEADLTFGELAQVKESFVRTLTTMLHARIQYPKDETEEDEDDLFVAAQKVSGTGEEPTEKIDGKSNRTK